MKTIAEQLRSEINQILSTSGPGPTTFPPELIERVVQYVREQASKGVTKAQCSQELGLSQSRLHYWLYARHRTALLTPSTDPSPALRPVQVSSEMVPVYDGVPERRYTVRSPAGWEVKDLTLKELTEILRGLV